MNLLCAVRTAASSEARGKGVLVVMNEEIHAAREVVKSHSANTETFVSPFWGPLGYVDPDRVVFRRNTLGRQSIRPPELVEDVHLIKLASGSDSLLIDFLVERNVRGLVLEAFGRGNVPPARIAGHPPCRGERDSGGHHHPDHSRARARRVRLPRAGPKPCWRPEGFSAARPAGPRPGSSLCWPLAWRRAVTSWRSFSIRRDRFHEKDKQVS